MSLSSVNGFVCFDCSDIAKARQGIDPAAPAFAPPRKTGDPASTPAGTAPSPAGAAPAPGTGLQLDRRA